MAASNRLLSIFKSSTPENHTTAFGAWQFTPGFYVSRALAAAGYDWACVDCEHGDIDDKDMQEAVRTLASRGTSPVVRIPGMEGWMIKRALDAGAHGIMVPLVQTVKECEQLVQWAKFPPEGTRGFGAAFTGEAFGLHTSAEYLMQANNITLLIVQIETKSALENIEEICKVDGVDGVLIGPFDLSLNIGVRFDGRSMPPELASAIQRIVKAAEESGKKAGMFCLDGAGAKKAVEQGFDFVSVTADASVMTKGLAVALAEAKS